MEQVGGGSVHWFTGLPLGTWLTIAAVLLAVGMVVLALTLAGIAKESDLRVRGWERREPVQEDEWWKREYPEVHDG